LHPVIPRWLRRGGPGRPGAPLFLLGVVTLFSCDNGIDPVDLESPPPSVRNLSVENGPGELTLRWDYLDEVSSDLSFSGYKVYMAREDWADGFGVWTAFRTRSGSTSYLPLLKRENSLSTGRMEVKVVNLSNGYIYSFYVVGVQNGIEGTRSGIAEEVPYDLFTTLAIRAETQQVPDWYLPGEGAISLHFLRMNRVGYLFEAATGKHLFRFMSRNEGGWLRIQSAGKNGEDKDVPTNVLGEPTGFLDDPETDRIEIAEGDYIFVWNTSGTLDWRGDDHYSRIRIANIVETHDDRRIIIDCAYQSRPDTPNL